MLQEEGLVMVQYGARDANQLSPREEFTITKYSLAWQDRSW